MDSVEFIKNIRDNKGLLVNFFDGTMALYNLIGHYEGLTVTSDSASLAEMRFSIDGEKENLDELLHMINHMVIGGYGDYRCEAYMDGDHLVIILSVI